MRGSSRRTRRAEKADSHRGILAVFSLLLIATLACSLPGAEFLFGTPTPAPEITPEAAVGPTPTPLPLLPPTLVETDPARGEELAPDSVLTLYFDQPMDQPSVEANFQVQPSVQGRFEWPDAATLSFIPFSALDRAVDYNVSVGAEARSAAGLSLAGPLEAQFRTAGFIEVSQVLPSPGATDVSSDALITVVFNRPVVPLQIEGDLPQPLSFDPQLQGTGEWVDTSIYAFRPEAPLPGGQTFIVEVEAGLTDAAGGLLPQTFSWSFTTSLPRLVSSEPAASAEDVALDEEIRLTFNQPMDPESVEAAFTLSAPGGIPVAGLISWEQANRDLVFKPQGLLAYGTAYTLSLTGPVRGAGGAALVGELSTTFRTVNAPAVLSTNPPNGGQISPQSSVQILLSAPMEEAVLLEALSITPRPDNFGGFLRSDGRTLTLFGDYLPQTSYQLTLSDSATDPYGTPLGAPFSSAFTVGDFDPLLDFPRFTEVLTLAGGRTPQIEVRARNVGQLNLSLYQLSLDEFFGILREGGVVFGEPTPRGTLLREWSQSVPDSPNTMQSVSVPLRPDRLATGTYLLFLDTPDDARGRSARLLVVRGIEVFMKSSPGNTFLWTVGLSDGEPYTGRPIRLLDENGIEFANGLTRDDGTLELAHSPAEDPFAPVYAISGEPGEGLFGLTSSAWADGIQPYSFGVGLSLEDPEFKTYLYTDRPIYRPGHTVHYRGVVRATEEARYRLPDLPGLQVRLQDASGDTIHTELAQLNEFGAFNGAFTLSEEAPIGSYFLETDYGSVFFDVAAFRKPEFTVSVVPSSPRVASGDPLSAEIQAEFFFGGPVANAQVEWTAWVDPFPPPGLPQPIDWFARASAFPFFGGLERLANGSGVTDADGKLSIELPTSVEDASALRVTIEATVTDESQVPVTGESQVELHPATLYFGLAPEQYSLRSGETAVVRLNSVDWDGAPTPGQQAEVRVERVTWEQTVDEEGLIQWVESAALVNEAQLTTDERGEVLFSFSPERAGTYRVRSVGEDSAGRRTIGEANVWVSGRESGVWRQPAADRLALVPDKGSYAPGETARILVPSPFEGSTAALVTIERGQVLSHQVLSLGGAQSVVEIPIEEIHAPNVFVSVALIRPSSGQEPAALAMGLVELPVSGEALELQLTLTPDRSRAAPRDSIRYELRATDASGQPVQAEISLGLVDLAVLALAEPNSPSPFESFYGRQPLRVATSASLAVSGEVGLRELPLEGIGGGGGGLALVEVRSEFPDTAYWNPSVVTDEDGFAQVVVELPDSLTTWRMEARAITRETLVGDARVDLVATKDLLVRPITPRFFTAGDRATVAAVVHNNRGESLPIEVRLTARGARILSTPTQTITVEANGQQRVEWQLAVADAAAVDLTFTAAGGGLQDASKPTIGTAREGLLPTLRLSAPDTAASSGQLDTGGQRIQIVSLPRRFDATQGELDISLELSLGAALTEALLDLEASPYDSTENVVSQFLPAVAVLRALQAVDAGELRLETPLERTLSASLLTLQHRQNADGGWGWWISSPSDSYLTAYALYGLAQSRAAGVVVEDSMLDGAVQYLQSSLLPPAELSDGTARDRQVFALFALAAADSGDLASTRQMAAAREALSPWGRALLAQTLARLAPGDAQIPALISDLDSAAIRSSTGAHWESEAPGGRNLASAITTSAHALRALLALDPQNPIVPDGVRWLLAARTPQASWSSTHDTAWAVLALADWLELSGGLRASFVYQVDLNGQTLASGQASPDAAFTSVDLSRPVSELLADRPNQLAIERGDGEGALYYTMHLRVFRPIEDVGSTSRGLTVQREYFLYDGSCGSGADNACPLADSAALGEQLLTRVTLIVPSDQYYVLVEDPYPAGMEPVDPSLQTSPTGAPPADFSFADPLRGGWGWWRFSRSELRDDRLVLFADFLPAGTYQYTYVLQAVHPGAYRVLPTRAWALYFPEVYGQAAGRIFNIAP